MYTDILSALLNKYFIDINKIFDNSYRAEVGKKTGLGSKPAGIQGR